MAELVVSKRYANALFDVAFSKKTYEKVEEELAFIVACLRGEPQFFQLLKSPLIAVQEKKEIINTIFKNKISQEVSNFLKIIIDKRREAYIEDIVNEYNALVDDVKNKVTAVAISAVPMKEEDLKKLQVNLSMSSGKNVQLINEVKPNVMGGILIKMGDKVIDGTVKSRLEQMNEQLSQIIV